MIDLDTTRPQSRISGQSTRIGAAHELAAADAALPEITIAGGRKSPQMPARYARKLDTSTGAVRNQLDAPRKPKS
jgi:hypothetical protein